MIIKVKEEDILDLLYEYTSNMVDLYLFDRIEEILKIGKEQINNKNNNIFIRLARKVFNLKETPTLPGTIAYEYCLKKFKYDLEWNGYPKNFDTKEVCSKYLIERLHWTLNRDDIRTAKGHIKSIKEMDTVDGLVRINNSDPFWNEFFLTRKDWQGTIEYSEEEIQFYKFLTFWSSTKSIRFPKEISAKVLVEKRADD